MEEHRPRLIAALLILSIAVFVPVRPASSAGPNFATAQHNITHRWYGALRYVAHHDRPIVMTANEVCFLTLLTLNEAIDDFGYQSRNRVSRTSSSACAYNGVNHNLYKVAYTQGIVPAGGVTLNESTQMPGTNSADRRQVPCALGTAYGFSWHVSSTHLAPSNPPLASQQSNWLRSAMSSSLIGNGPRIVGGDFNLRPREHSPYSTGPWREGWIESDDTCYAWNKDRRTTTGGSSAEYACTSSPAALRAAKIDYLWASAFWYVGGFGVADIRCDVSSSSHHCLLYSIFRWR